jgi:hypothetical protein
MKRFFLFHEEHGFLKLKPHGYPGVYKADVAPYPGTKFGYTSQPIAQRRLEEALRVADEVYECAGVQYGGNGPPRVLPGNPKAHVVNAFLDTHGLSRAEAKQVKAAFVSKADGRTFDYHYIHFDIREVKIVEVQFDWRIAGV